MTENKIFIYDTLLRDGAQGKGISFSQKDKLEITKLLSNIGIDYIEGGYAGSNPKDLEFFSMVKDLDLNPKTKISAFGSTRKANSLVEEDNNIKSLVSADTEVVTLFGKSWDLHVTEVLRTTLDNNLIMIKESVNFFKSLNKEIIYDAEHFFDGYKADPTYALETLKMAAEAGADWIILCDTNGGSLPSFIQKTLKTISKEINCKLGIHTHNDSELAIANTLTAVEAGCLQVQGTINGYGERCGNANLTSIIPTLELKMGYKCLPSGNLAKLYKLAHDIAEIANIEHNSQSAYVGSNSFAHKGGVHVSAVERVSASYEHISPELVGNKRKVLLSELSGRGNVRIFAEQVGMNLSGREGEILNELKKLEKEGYQFEDAEGSFELHIRKSDPDYKSPFEIIDSMVLYEKRSNKLLLAEAMIKISVDGTLYHTAAEGAGPVDALDKAIRKALAVSYPDLSKMKLSDYKVHILDPKNATSATTRVLIEASCGNEIWKTTGSSNNIIEASLKALTDSIELFIIKQYY